MPRQKFRISVVFTCAVIGFGGFFAARAIADDVVVPTPQYVFLGPEDLQQLAAPVALYPDALLAEILVACTYPNDIGAAAQYLDAGNDPNLIDNQGFDLSVAGVARYPDLLHYLATNLDWTNNLGLAFLNQQADVMAAVQALRSQALAAGNLLSNDQQQVVVDNGTIEIIPTNPQIIYPPIYDPILVYRRPVIVVGTAYVPLIRFWRGIQVGIWLHHDLDWYDHTIYVGSWGFDRPWWHHDRGFEYTHDRPGLFVSNTIINVNIHNRVVNVQGGQWSRQRYAPEKPLPRVVVNNKTVINNNYGRPGTGYAPRRPIQTGGGLPNYNNGATAAHESDRGRASLQKAGNTQGSGNLYQQNRSPGNSKAGPAQPVREPPNAHAAEPASEPKRHAVPPPTPAPHPAPPARVVQTERKAPEVRGGATGGYTNGSDASRASSRGASSRSNANGASNSKKNR